jgi:hypothetical protein
MHVRHVALVFCLLSISALGQSPAQGLTSLQTPIHGIKIFSSSFDAKTQTAKLDFMNDSPSDITAWGYCLKTQNVKGDNVEHGGCREVETLGPVISRQVQEQITNKAMIGDCPDCHVLHPGEHKTLSVDFSSGTVATAEIEIKLIIYGNGRVETNGNEGLRMQQEFATRRQGALNRFQELVEIGQGILADTSNQHPTVAMIEELQRRIPAEPELGGVLHDFKRPGWRKANDAEFVPEDEHGYLQKFVAEQQMKAAELSKHQIAGVNQ